MNKVNWHAAVIVLALVAVPIVGVALKVDPAVIGYAVTGVIALATASGFLHVAEVPNVEAMAAKITVETQKTIDIVKTDLLEKHAANAQNIAVHDAQLAVVVPAVIAASPIIVPPQMKQVEEKPHLVE